MTLFEMHPFLLSLPGYAVGGNLPGPWRDTRLCSNDGRPQAFNAVVNFIWLQVRPPGMPLNHMNTGILMNRLPTLATNFWIDYGQALHPSWDAAVTALRPRADGTLMPLYKARGSLLNVLIRDRFLTQAMVNAGVFPPIPARIAAYFALPQVPRPFNPPRRPMMNVRANPTSSLVYARQHEILRVRRRKHRTVWYHNQEHRLIDLTHTQCVLLDNDENPPFNNVVGVGWLWAATQP